MLSYYEVLDEMHRHLAPRTYLEIGVHRGRSTGIALDGTVVVGVDPAPQILHPLAPGTIIERTTSDEFFASMRLTQHFGGLPIDLAFIDGMHLFEYAMRDFCNVERHSSNSTVVLLHDCLPRSPGEAARERAEPGWTGDVWKVLWALRRTRSDLSIHVVDAPPTGLGLVTGFGQLPAGASEADAMIAEYSDVPYDAWCEAVGTDMPLVPGTWEAIVPLLPAAADRPPATTASLVRRRARRRIDHRTRLRRARHRALTSSATMRLLRATSGIRHQLKRSS